MVKIKDKPDEFELMHRETENEAGDNYYQYHSIRDQIRFLWDDVNDVKPKIEHVDEPECKQEMNFNDEIVDNESDLEQSGNMENTETNKSTNEEQQNGHEVEKMSINQTKEANAKLSKKIAMKRQKEYTCDICKLTTTQKSKLENHILGHTGEKPFECKVCKKSFAKETYLKSHEKTHGDEVSR